MQFTDRIDAASKLAEKLKSFGQDCVVYALPRGGVVVGAEIAKQLKLPLDLILVRKIGHQFQEEYAICAVAENREPICNKTELENIDKSWFKQSLRVEQQKNSERRQKYFPKNWQPPRVTGKTAIIVDDGIATGLTMRAAVEAVAAHKPTQIIVAVPVASTEAVNELIKITKDVIVLDDPANFFGAVGTHYQTFPQVEDEEVIKLIKASKR